MDNIIRWLHLSDLHYSIKNYQSEWLRDKLVEFLKDKKGQFNLLTITGDLLYQFNSNFDEVKKFLKLVVETIGMDSENIFIVPGNHDFKRSDLRKMLLSGIKKDETKIKDIVSNLNEEITQQLIESQTEFWKFHEDFLHRKDNYEELHFLNSTDKYNIINLNTCIISGEEKVLDNKKIPEEGTLSIHMKKLLITLKSVRDSNKPNIAIGHHSLECFVPEEREQIVQMFEDYGIDIYFCGHIHKDKYIIYLNGKRHIPAIVCGSNMLDTYATPSFIIGEIDLNTCKCKVNYFNWTSSNEWRITNDVDRKIADDNSLNFTLDRLSKKNKI